MYDGVYFCDNRRRIIYWNAAAEKITGYKAEEVTGISCADNLLVHTNDQGENLCKTAKCPALKAMQTAKIAEEKIFLKHKQGYRVPVLTRVSPVKDDKGQITGAVEIFSDNTEQLSAFKKIKKLQELAFIDSLTGIGNRRYTENRINAKLEEKSRYRWTDDFGILFIDIDTFKAINDKFGHAAGDLILKVTSKTILKNLRQEDFIGRWGGEEFVAIISGVDKKKLFAIAEKLRFLIEQSLIYDSGKNIRISVSIGATMAKKKDKIKSLIKRADILMYESKKKGKNCVTTG